MFVRLILGLVVLVAVLALLRYVRRRLGTPGAPRAVEQKTARCAACGVYFPRAEAIVAGGRSYCSRQHAERASV